MQVYTLDLHLPTSPPPLHSVPANHHFIWNRLLFNPTCVTVQYWPFSLWLISLCTVPCSFSHVVPNVNISFFLWLHHVSLYIPYNIPLCVCPIFMIHSPRRTCGLFHVLAVGNNVVMHTGTPVSLLRYDFISFGCTPRTGIAGSHVYSIF